MKAEVATTNAHSRSLSEILSLAEDLRSLSASWAEDRSDWTAAMQTMDLPALKIVTERTANVPALPSIDKNQFCRPLERDRAVKAVVIAMSSLAGSRPADETKLLLKDLADVVLDVGASEADMLLARRWLHSSPGAPGRPPDLPLFRFKPGPGEWDALLRAAKRHNAEIVKRIEQRQSEVAACRSRLDHWPQFVEQVAKLKERLDADRSAERARMRDEIDARDRRIEAARARAEADAASTRAEDARRKRELRRQMDAWQASLSPELRARLKRPGLHDEKGEPDA